MLFSYIQQIVDDQNRKGMFILTGSNNFLLLNTVTQTLVGRIALFKLLPFSLEEADGLYEKNDAVTHILSGGYPRLLTEKPERNFFYQNYIESYAERDVRQLLNIKDTMLFRRFMQLCAGRIGGLIDMTSLANDTGISVKTVQEWLSLLQTSFICFLLQPWYQNRNKRLVKTPKLYFYDTGVACALAGIRTEEQLNRDRLYGSLFENLVILEQQKAAYNTGLLR